MAFTQSTTAVLKSGLPECAEAKRNVFALNEVAVCDAAWYGRSTDPLRSAFRTFCFEGLNFNHLGINDNGLTKRQQLLRSRVITSQSTLRSRPARFDRATAAASETRKGS